MISCFICDRTLPAMLPPARRFARGRQPRSPFRGRSQPYPPVKGIAHVPAHNTPMKPGRRELLLTAIANARGWIRDVERGQSFADIARREAKAERHIRHLAPLAFVSPRIVAAILEGIRAGEAHGDGACQDTALFLDRAGRLHIDAPAAGWRRSERKIAIERGSVLSINCRSPVHSRSPPGPTPALMRPSCRLAVSGIGCTSG